MRLFDQLSEYDNHTMKVLRLAFVVLFVVWLLPGTVSAHEIRPAVGNAIVDIPAGEFTAEIRLNLEAAMARVGAEHEDTDTSPNAQLYNELRALSGSELKAKFEAFSAEFGKGITFNVDGKELPVELVGMEVLGTEDASLARDSTVFLNLFLPPGSQEMTIKWDWGPLILRVSSVGGKSTERFREFIQPGSFSQKIPLGTPIVARSAFATFTNFLKVGFDHIIPKGLDHILFVVGLFLLSMHWKPLLWQVTAFTIAHTITLALGMLNIVSVPASIVEPLIALSIVYVCVENIFSDKLHKWRPVLVFAFGLLHGLGFAGILNEINEPGDNFIASLIGFNIGVEIGQLAVIAGCFLLVGFWFGSKSWYRQRITIPASAIIALIGLFWFVERVGWLGGGSAA